jgi:hypothetical protein
LCRLGGTRPLGVSNGETVEVQSEIQSEGQSEVKSEVKSEVQIQDRTEKESCLQIQAQEEGGFQRKSRKTTASLGTGIAAAGAAPGASR